MLSNVTSWRFVHPSVASENFPSYLEGTRAVRIRRAVCVRLASAYGFRTSDLGLKPALILYVIRDVVQHAGVREHRGES